MKPARRKLPKPRAKRKAKKGPTVRVAVSLQLTREQLTAWRAWHLRYRGCRPAGGRDELLAAFRADMAWITTQFGQKDPGEWGRRLAEQEIAESFPELS